jgi:hypothetical protein
MGGTACEQIASRRVRKVMESAITRIQFQVQVHRTAVVMVDALGKQAGLPPSWREGDPSWEEAYALLQPELAAAMNAAGERLARWHETHIPPLLETKACARQLALLETPAGALADRIDFALSFRDTLARFEKTFGIPARLKTFVEIARAEVTDDLALADRKNLARTETGLAAAKKETSAFGKLFMTALRGAGDGEPATEEKLNGEAGAAMMARHKDALVAIIRRAKH